MSIPAIMSQLPFGHGFELNTNVFETNLINLAVVVGIVVSFGGDALRSLLETRKQTILEKIREVEQKASQAAERLKKAEAQLETAKKKSVEIREQGKTTAEKEKKQAVREMEQNAARLEELQKENLRFQQQKALSTISQQAVSLALNRVRDKLENQKNQKDSTFQKDINNFSLVLLNNFKG